MLCVSLFFLFCSLLLQLVLRSITMYALYSSTPALSTLHLNLNMNLNPETMVHNDQTDTFYEPALLEPFKQIGLAMLHLK